MPMEADREGKAGFLFSGRSPDTDEGWNGNEKSAWSVTAKKEADKEKRKMPREGYLLGHLGGA